MRTMRFGGVRGRRLGFLWPRSGYTITQKRGCIMHPRFCKYPPVGPSRYSASSRGAPGTWGLFFYHMAPTAQPRSSAVDETMRETGHFGDVPDGARSQRTASLPPRRGLPVPHRRGRAHSRSQTHPDCSVLSTGVGPQPHATPSRPHRRSGRGSGRARVRSVPPICATASIVSIVAPPSPLLVHRGRRPYPSLTLPHTPSHSLTLPVPCSAGLDADGVHQKSWNQEPSRLLRILWICFYYF